MTTSITINIIIITTITTRTRQRRRYSASFILQSYNNRNSRFHLILVQDVSPKLNPAQVFKLNHSSVILVRCQCILYVYGHLFFLGFMTRKGEFSTNSLDLNIE